MRILSVSAFYPHVFLRLVFLRLVFLRLVFVASLIALSAAWALRSLCTYMRSRILPNG